MDEVLSCRAAATGPAHRVPVDFERQHKAKADGVEETEPLWRFTAAVRAGAQKGRSQEERHRTLEAAGVIFVAETGEGPGVRLRNRRVGEEND